MNNRKFISDMEVTYNNAIGYMNMNTVKPKTCVLYARTATREQTSRTSIANQLRICQRAAKEQGYRIIGVYKDFGISGNTIKRSGLKKLLKDCKKQKIDCVIVFNIDRLGRDVDVYRQIKQLLHKSGTQIISCQQPGITNNPLESIFASIAEWESRTSIKRNFKNCSCELIEGKNGK